jgi:LPS sulfotransferase NodH
MKSTDERLDGLFAELAQAPDGPIPRTKVAIISTPRCGSKYFCESLASSGRFGRPLEWVNVLYISAYARLLGLKDVPLNQYFQFILAKTTSPNGVFAINFHVEQYLYWRDKNVDLLRFGFDKLYYVFRKDKLAQALSFAKATRSGQWRSTDRAIRDTSAAEMRNSEIFSALYNLSLHEEYYKAHLVKHVRREFRYEDYTASDRCFHDVLADNGIEHQDIKNFRSDVTIQRASSDAQRICDLVSYMGHQ